MSSNYALYRNNDITIDYTKTALKFSHIFDGKIMEC